MTIQRATRFLALALLVLSLALAACGGKSTEASGGGATTGASASCAMLVSYDGHTYLGTAVEAATVAGESIGNGTIPPCNDTGGAGTTSPAEHVEVTSVQGVPPSVAIMLAGRNDVVLVRDDVKPHDLEEYFPR
jgi:DnaJ-class molecular chaperone